MKFFVVFIIITYALSNALLAQTSEEFNHNRYIKEIKKERQVKDNEMLTEEHSPISEIEKATFRKLHYYRPKVSFRKEASFERFGQATRFLMKTTTDRLPEYSLYGVVNFRHKGKNYSLNVYQNIG
jgi:uncharacterized protein (DUF1684 family)